VATDEHPKEDISIRLKISVLVILSLIIAAYTAMEDTYAGFLMTFTVKHLNWTKPQPNWCFPIEFVGFTYEYPVLFIMELLFNCINGGTV
jgi:hypothetical protein